MNIDPITNSSITTEQCVEQALSILVTSLTSAELDTPESGAMHHIVLTGGAAGMSITSRLQEVAKALSPRLWSHVHIWWGDERFVPIDSEMRNDHNVEQLLGDFYIAENVHRAPSTSDCDLAQRMCPPHISTWCSWGLVLTGTWPLYFPIRPCSPKSAFALAWKIHQNLHHSG